MVQPTNDDAGPGRTGALEALLDVAREPDIANDYRMMDAAFGLDDYRQIVALAWRHQFNEDRSRFKREIHELQQHVSQRIIAEPERSE